RTVGRAREGLSAATAEEPGEAMKATLLGLWPKHRESLASALEARMRDRTAGLQKAIAERADKEASDITTILTELRRTIEAKLDEPELRQMVFEGWTDPEREQLERNMDALRAKVRSIPQEIARETAAIRSRF